MEQDLSDHFRLQLGLLPLKCAPHALQTSEVVGGSGPGLDVWGLDVCGQMGAT